MMGVNCSAYQKLEGEGLEAGLAVLCAGVAWSPWGDRISGEGELSGPLEGMEVGVLWAALWSAGEAQEAVAAASPPTGSDRGDKNQAVGHTETGCLHLAWVEERELEEEPVWVGGDPA